MNMLMPKTLNNSLESNSHNQTRVESNGSKKIMHRKMSTPAGSMKSKDKRRMRKGLTDPQRKEAKFRYSTKMNKLNEDSKKQKKDDAKLFN